MNHALRGQQEQAFSYAAEAEIICSQRRLNDLLSCVQLARGTALVAVGEHAAAYRDCAACSSRPTRAFTSGNGTAA
jgi:hypothetical protein